LTGQQGTRNADGSVNITYRGDQRFGITDISSDQWWSMSRDQSLNPLGGSMDPSDVSQGASSFGNRWDSGTPGYWESQGVTKPWQQYALAGFAYSGHLMDFVAPGTSLSVPLSNALFKDAFDNWGWTDSTPRYQNARQYGDNSILYDYEGNSADQILVTPKDWSGNGLPTAATQGAEGWATSKPLPAGEEFTREELIKDYGLYWKGWSTEQVAGATKNLFGEMTNMSMEQSRDLADKLYGQANARAEKTITDFPAVSQRALDATRIAGDALTRDMTSQFNANLDTYMPGWREKIVGASGALTEGTANISQAFKDKILPELSYNLLQTQALLRNASRPMLAGEVPMSVSLAALGNQRGTSAINRGLTARDLGLTSRDMRGLGLAGINAASALQPAVDKGILGIFGAQGEAARAHGATVGQFTPPIVDTASLYGGIMQGLNAGAAMKPDQIFSLGMQSYEGQLNAGMNLFGQLQQLAVDQAATLNATLQE